MDVLRIREDKLSSKLDRDVAVEARARFLASVAKELHDTEKNDRPELAAVYLQRASMLRFEEYGESGSIFPKDVVCRRCGVLWNPSYVKVELWRSKRITNGKLKRLQEKQTHRPWTLSKLQKKLLKEHAKTASDPYRLRYECKHCGAKTLVKVHSVPDSTGPVGRMNQHTSTSSTQSLNTSTSQKDTRSGVANRRSASISGSKGDSTPGPAQRKSHVNKNRKSLLKQVTEMNESSKLRSPLQAFLSSL